MPRVPRAEIPRSCVCSQWRETDPNRKSSSSNDRHDIELRTFEALREADTRSIGKRQFGQGSWLIVAPRRNASKMVIFHPIKFKSFPAPIAVSSSWTIDCRWGPNFSPDTSDNWQLPNNGRSLLEIQVQVRYN